MMKQQCEGSGRGILEGNIPAFAWRG